MHRDTQAVKRKSGDGIGSAGALQSHALAIANGAIERYREFAVHMTDRGNDELSDLFSRLFELKTEHALHLAGAAPCMPSPKLDPGVCAWLYCGPPPPAAREFIFRMLTPRQAVEIAMAAEERAKAYFAQVLAAADDAGVRALAIEHGRDEDLYIAWLRDALAGIPEPFWPSEDCPGDPTTPQAL